MEGLRQTLQWWQSLSPTAKAIGIIVLVAVVAALGAGMYQAYCAPVVLPIAASEGDETTAAALPATKLLSLPLPGTRRREEAEIAQRLESALSDYDYIASARVIFGSPLAEAESTEASSPRLSLHLRLEPTKPPPDEWVENLVTFVLHTVPGLASADLLIVDSSGALLFSEGRLNPAATSPAVSPPVPIDPNPGFVGLSGSGMVALGLLVGAVAVALVVYLAVRTRGRRRGEAEAHSVEAGSTSVEQPNPLEFLEGCPPGKLAVLLDGERPEVVALALHNLGDEEIRAQAYRALTGAVDSLPESVRPPREETLAALAEGLRAKLVAGENNVALQPTATVLDAGSDGD